MLGVDIKVDLLMVRKEKTRLKGRLSRRHKQLVCAIILRPSTLPRRDQHSGRSAIVVLARIEIFKQFERCRLLSDSFDELLLR